MVLYRVLVLRNNEMHHQYRCCDWLTPPFDTFCLLVQASPLTYQCYVYFQSSLLQVALGMRAFYAN